MLRLLGLALVLLLCAPGVAQATSCAVPELESSLGSADVVFVATVLSHRDHSVYLLDTQRVFKGSVPKAVRVRAGGMKGASFEIGKRFLVFARLTPADTEAPLFAHLCGGSQRADQAKAWLAQLGSGSAPGSALLGGHAPDAGAAPASAPAPAPEPAPEPAPVPAPEPAPEPAPSPAPAPAPDAPAPSPAAAAPDAGCAACALGARAPAARLPGLGLACAALALAFARRLRAPRGMLRP